jgi:hypothetical protein
MASRYLMQIVDRDTGDVVRYEPGQVVESDFVEDCVEQIVRLGVGLGRTTDHVAADIRRGIEDAIYALKRQVRPS